MKRFCLFMAILCAMLLALCCCGPDPHYLQQGETERSSAPIEYVYIHSDDTPLEYQNTTNAHFGFHEWMSAKQTIDADMMFDVTKNVKQNKKQNKTSVQALCFSLLVTRTRI